MLNAAYAYLAEQAEAADRIAVPAYQVAQVEPKEIESRSRRLALDEWLDAPFGDSAAHEQAVVAYLTS